MLCLVLCREECAPRGGPPLVAGVFSVMTLLELMVMYRDAGMGGSPFWSNRVSSGYHLSQKEEHTQSRIHSTALTYKCNAVHVARGCGVAYGLRRCHICSSVHGTCERIHMNILRSPIGSWFCEVGWSVSPPQPRAGARRNGTRCCSTSSSATSTRSSTSRR